jgi:glycosyltransferase involved in cell wall biosynthesis
MKQDLRRRVIVFKSELLHDSEVFIREQVRAYSRWKPLLAGFFPVGNLDFTGLDLDFLGGKSRSRWTARARTLIRELNMPWPGVVRRLKHWNPSLLHIHFGTELVSIWPTARSLGVPILTTLHGLDINIDDAWWRERGGLRGRMYPARLVAIGADPHVYFVAVSDAIRKRAIDRGLPASKIFTRYIGVDVSRFVPAGLPIIERRPRILYVGRMVEKKGANILIEAFARVRKQIENAELVMVGDGPLLAEFKQLAQQLRVPVTFTGTLSSDQVKQQMDEARVFCLPSITATNGDAEGFGLVLLEAQACGVPVVTSARGGATEGIKDGVTGCAFPERDVPALVSALIRLLADDALLTSMAFQARRHVEEKFDIRRCTVSLENLYDDVSQESAVMV